MDKAINNGGPAFPTADNGSGMSLRDWFAGQALQGYVSSRLYCDREPDDLAKWSYDVADAMIARK